MKVTTLHKPKLCHFLPGDVIQLVEQNADQTVLPGIYVVACFSAQSEKATRRASHAMNGLYSFEDPLFLVNVETGEAIKMPHLSSRAIGIEAQLVVPGKVQP